MNISFWFPLLYSYLSSFHISFFFLLLSILFKLAIMFILFLTHNDYKHQFLRRSLPYLYLLFPFMFSTSFSFFFSLSYVSSGCFEIMSNLCFVLPSVPFWDPSFLIRHCQMFQISKVYPHPSIEVGRFFRHMKNFMVVLRRPR